ncbi:MAG: hypothetical protein ACPL1G_01185 [Thermodesulfovibrionales bacterium]
MIHRQNYLARMEQKKEDRIAAGMISEHYPEVSGIVIHMTYYQKASNPVLMIRTVNFFPTSYAYFNMECMIKGCVEGGFDLTSIIDNLVRNHKKSGKGKMVCCGESDFLSPDHAYITYEISIHYK